MGVLSIIAKEQLRLTEAPVPEPGPGQVRIRVAYVGICGSDLHYYFDGGIEGAPLREPLTSGHELSATVDLDPSGTWTAGTPVTVHPATLGTPIPALADKPHLWPNGAYLGSARTMPHTQGPPRTTCSTLLASVSSNARSSGMSGTTMPSQRPAAATRRA